MQQTNLSNSLCIVSRTVKTSFVMYKWIIMKQLITSQTLDIMVTVNFFNTQCFQFSLMCKNSADRTHPYVSYPVGVSGYNIQTTNGMAFLYDKTDTTVFPLLPK